MHKIFRYILCKRLHAPVRVRKIILTKLSLN